jgi:hypothetical protein
MESESRARWQAIVVMVLATTCYCLMIYRSPLDNYTWDSVLFYLVIPFVTVMLLGHNPLRWGLTLGRWKWTLGLTLAAAVGVVILVLIAMRMPVFRAYYDQLEPEANALWSWLGILAVEMLAWEYLFRSFMLFGLEPALGELAIYVQMIPFAIAHAGKPEVETLSSIAGGILVGYMVRHCRSFWPAFLLHLLLGALVHLI